MTSLTTIHAQMSEFATTLVHQDSDVADDVLAARYDLENAIESPRPADEAKHLDTAYDTLKLALKMDNISDLTPDQRETLEQFKTDIDSHRP